MAKTTDVAFFDIGLTLAEPVFASPFPPRKLVGLRVYSYILDILQEIRAQGIRCGIISNKGPQNTEDEVKDFLTQAGLNVPQVFDGPIIFKPKDQPQTFTDAAAAANCPVERCLFVGEDKNERFQAARAGFRVAPHPALAHEASQGRTLRHYRFAVRPDVPDDQWRPLMQEFRVTPLRITGDNPVTVFAIASATAAMELLNHPDNILAVVESIGRSDAALLADVYLFRDNRLGDNALLPVAGQAGAVFSQANPGFAAVSASANSFLGSASGPEEDPADWLLTATAAELIVAIPAGYSIEDFHFPQTQHGHNEKLIPNPALLAPSATGSAAFLPPGAVPQALPAQMVQALKDVASQEITEQLIRDHIRRYAGADPLDGEGSPTIDSRHILRVITENGEEKSANELAVAQLRSDLTACGAEDAALHTFRHEGMELFNVEAHFPGTDPTPEIARQEVLITAHLDSIAINNDPRTDPAPGADDDASGVAAVLAAARAIQRLRIQSGGARRTIRLVLFNAEEHGLVGSKHYARDAFHSDRDIIGVFQMDMIGYNLDPPENVAARRWEVHAGYPASRTVQERSLLLADIIRHVAPHVTTTLPGPQIYKHGGPTLPDLAAGRSDHASFHQVGYAACVTSGDFFPGDSEATIVPQPEPNKNYHSETDTASDDFAERSVDFGYAADIARAVFAAAWVTANA